MLCQLSRFSNYASKQGIQMQLLLITQASHLLVLQPRDIFSAQIECNSQSKCCGGLNQSALIHLPTPPHVHSIMHMFSHYFFVFPLDFFLHFFLKILFLLTSPACAIAHSTIYINIAVIPVQVIDKCEFLRVSEMHLPIRRNPFALSANSQPTPRTCICHHSEATIVETTNPQIFSPFHFALGPSMPNPLL